MKLNLGCGRTIMEGWVNIDRVKLDGVDVIAELDVCGIAPLPFPDNSVDEFLLSHVIEHLQQPLPLMQELHRIAKPNAICTIRVPHGASDDAWEDPTHVRPYFPGSFGYFSQPYYWRASYNYLGDWLTEKIEMYMAEELIGAHDHRNQVTEMVAHLIAVKPIRQPLKELQVQPRIVYL